MKRIIVVWLVMMLIGGIIGIADLSTDAEIGNGDDEIKSASKSGLTSHGPISINGNSQFTSANGISSGDGTPSSPYIIENWEIDTNTTHGINIKNTNAYFIIKNCVIHDEKNNYGIYFSSVQNGKIQDVDSYNNERGIFLTYSSNNTISNCDTYNNSDYGIYLVDSSNNNQITNCDIYNNHIGIWLYGYSNNNTITNCNVYNNYEKGIYLSYSSNNEVHYCDIYDNTGYGVYNYNTGAEYSVNATDNWWGAVNGPGQDGVNPVNSNVLYDPWLTEPVGGIANQLPTVSTTSPSSDATVSGAITVQGTASDADGTVQKVEIKIDSGSWILATGTSSWSYSWDTTTVSNAEHTIYVRSYDGADYSSIDSVTVTVDNAAGADDEDGVGDAEEPEKKEEKGFIPGFESFILLIALAGCAILLKHRKRLE